MAKFGDVVQEFYVGRFHANMAERAGRLRGVTEPGQARAYIDDARRRVRKSFQLPEHSGEPAARITGRLRGNGFTVEKLLYESRPGLLVSANYYLPEKISGRHPAVLFLCGHSGTGKAGDTYQMAAQALALCGFAVLIPDPVGQGERGQFHGIPGAEALSRNCTHEHNMYGKQLLLTGEFFGTWRVFDAVRALDWLLARPEVDATRVGVTGNSGGGTLTTYVNALDDRITMAAPCCYITRWWRHVENELPVDAEQTPPGLAAAGGEMADMLFAAAPRPLLICGQRDDFFDPRGTLECYDELRRVYRILGRENEVEVPRNVVDALISFKQLLQNVTAQPLPNFFRIGYCKLAGQNISLDGRSVEELNAAALEYLDADFMNEFLALATAGVRHSAELALEGNRAFVQSAERARSFFAEDGFAKKDAIALCKQLNALVDASIDRLDTVKDSLAYTFRQSFRSAINRYFYYKKRNPKEEARFARQTKKREALIAKGRRVDWKVVPKVVMDLDVGDSIVVTGGAWKDTEGVISAVNQAKQMVTIQVELFGRATPVEISFSEVNKIG